MRSDTNLTDEQFLRDPTVESVTVEEEGSGEEVLVTLNSTASLTTTFTSVPPKPIKCYDISNRCSKIKPLCTRQEYRNIMVRQCAKTCDACKEFSNLPPAARCRDAFQRYRNNQMIKTRKCF
uniref:ShKT domain-containing protein n=1 Tax=Caenorhabditis japonica TaxID=281687 RepID=A0A8R1DYV0_CAEJA